MQMLRNLAIGQFYLVGLVGQNGPNQTENTEVVDVFFPIVFSPRNLLDGRTLSGRSLLAEYSNPEKIPSALCCDAIMMIN